MSLKIGDRIFSSRLFIGTGKFSSSQVMQAAIEASDSEMVTVALKRVDSDKHEESLVEAISKADVALLPNTSGARNANEAILAAQLGREALQTNWVKLEIHPDPNYLLPDPMETYHAAKELCRDGFIVLPYINADPVLCKRLEDIGVAAVMPLGAPIGSNLGLTTLKMLEIIIEQSCVPVIVDAGIGAPSDASQALEIGADAVLVNTAIAVAKDPIQMAQAFALSVRAGRLAFESRLGAKNYKASASSPNAIFNM